jgi:hypothetical protein
MKQRLKLRVRAGLLDAALDSQMRKNLQGTHS